jgi:hypothetical protein
MRFKSKEAQMKMKSSTCGALALAGLAAVALGGCAFDDAYYASGYYGGPYYGPYYGGYYDDFWPDYYYPGLYGFAFIPGGGFGHRFDHDRGEGRFAGGHWGGAGHWNGGTRFAGGGHWSGGGGHWSGRGGHAFSGGGGHGGGGFSGRGHR